MNNITACYSRVSTENQIENYSIEAQSERLKAYCKAKDFNNIKFYTDPGFSGGNIKRPALQLLLSDISKGIINRVIVYKLDRLSRSQKDTLSLIEDIFLPNKVDFISVNENFDTSTPFGRAMIGILSVFAQLEKDQITERFTMGRIGRAKEGKFHGGAYIPTGYDYIDGYLHINEYEAMQVRQVYEMFLKGHSIHSIWKHMQSNYTTKYGTWNSDTLIRKVLHNKLYIGYVSFGKELYKGLHTPIIDEATFHKVQDLFNTNKKTVGLSSLQKTPFRASNLLTSKIYCKRCGARYHGEHGNYSCYSRTKGDKKQIKDPNCKNKKWKIPELNKYVMDFIKHIKLDYTYEESQKQIVNQNENDNTNAVLSRVHEIETQVSRIIDLYQIGTISKEQIKERTRKLHSEKDILLKSIEDSRLTAEPVTLIEQSKSMQYKLLNIVEESDLPEKRMLLSMLIDKISIDSENVDIFLNF